MEVLRTDTAYYLRQETEALCITRQTSALLTPIPADSVEEGAECLGLAFGWVGLLRSSSIEGDSGFLLLVADSDVVAFHPFSDAPIRILRRLLALPLDDSPLPEGGLAPCPTHSVSLGSPDTGLTAPPAISLLHKGGAKIGSKLRGLQPKAKTSAATNGEAAPTNRRLLDDLLRLFNDAPSFYFTQPPGPDLTRSVLQLATASPSSNVLQDVDERFMWNSHLVKEGMKGSESNDRWRHWIIGLVQGYVGQKEWTDQSTSKRLGLTLVSRRSRHRAGTRYIKRGIDDKAQVANAVETEQILNLDKHCLSFTQPGYKYRPPPRIDRKKEETLPVLKRHLTDLITFYGQPLIIVNLINQTGSEHVVGEAFLDHFLDANVEGAIYTAFDFHEHCRGLQFRNVRRLLDALEPHLQSIRFTWAVPGSAPMCQQKGILRVNCMDCLDRTNVVMMTVGRRALELQLTKLGFLSPDEILAPSLQMLLNRLWADSGDAISRQYAGTAALKGDFTRSGERNLVGVMKDGYNSASRYYVNHLRDATRQAAMDLVLGHRHQPLAAAEEEEDVGEHESLRLLVQEYQAFFTPDNEALLGAWALLDADQQPNSRNSDVDSIIVLTKQALYFGEYCALMDKFTDCARVDLGDINGLQMGPMPTSWSIKKDTSKPNGSNMCLRVLYSKDGSEHAATWRAGKTRLFNNLAIAIRTPSEGEEYLRAIAEQMAFAVSRPEVTLQNVPKIEPRKTRRLNALLSGFADVGGDALKGAGGALKGAGGALKSRLAGFGLGRKNSSGSAHIVPATGVVFSSEETLPLPSIQVEGAEGEVLEVPEMGIAASRSEGTGLGLIGRIGSVPSALFDFRNKSNSNPKIPTHPFQSFLPRIQASNATVILL